MTLKVPQATPMPRLPPSTTQANWRPEPVRNPNTFGFNSLQGIQLTGKFTGNLVDFVNSAILGTQISRCIQFLTAKFAMRWNREFLRSKQREGLPKQGIPVRDQGF
jgi:hypothetical protein